MSGGSFNYAYFKASDSTVFEGLEDYRDIERWLRSQNRHLAADEVLKFILDVETAQHRLSVIGSRIENLLKAAEWTASCDTSIDAVDEAYMKLVQG